VAGGVVQTQLLHRIVTVPAVMAVAAMLEQMILQPKMAPQILAAVAVAVLTVETHLAVMVALA